jgi:hypothetical protein
MVLCSFDGCETRAIARGLCRAHYDQQRAGKELHPVKSRKRVPHRICSFEGCGRPYQAKGLCDGHYQQVKAGKELTALRVHVDHGDTCLVEGCSRPHYRGGRCYTHHDPRRSLDDSVPIAGRCDQGGPCAVPGCDLTAISRGLCKPHYKTRANFNLSDEQIAALFAEPKCWICGTRDPGQRAFSIDHDHSCCANAGESCGQCVRGLLCGSCNRALGLLRDDPSILMAAADYLEGGYVRAA